MVKKDRREIFELFVEAFKGKDFKVVSGLNPCCVEYAGVHINVYIKNLTPAQLSNNNPDVWRCQLPARPIFADFKISKNLFLFLGYDATNDVYSTWNPFWVKQRLNIGTNISMYSRYSIQKKAAEALKIIQYDLNHNGIVVVIPRLLLTYYIDNLSNYFDHDTKYVAIGSSLRRKQGHLNYAAEEIYAIFTNRRNEDFFREYLSHLELEQNTKDKNLSFIKWTFKQNLFVKHKEIFIKYDKLSEYGIAIDEFCKTKELTLVKGKFENEYCDYINASLKCYLNSLMEAIEKKNGNIKQKVQSLTNLCTPETLKIMADLMCKEEPQELEAMNVLYNAVGDIYNQSMSLNDWIKLLRSTDWTKIQ